MTALLVVGVIMLLSGLVILSKSPAALAVVGVGAAILVPYNLAPTPGEARTMDAQEITIEQREDGPYITTRTAPEHIVVSEELWNQILTEAPPIGESPAEDDPRWAWVEEINHADEDRDNDGYMLHIDATNVSCAYRLVREDEDGTRLLTLASWGER